MLVPHEMQNEQNKSKDSNNKNHMTFEQYTSNVRLTYEANTWRLASAFSLVLYQL